MKANLKKALQIFAAIICIATTVIASAGSLNYAHLTGYDIYTVFGVLNLGLAGYASYKLVKSIKTK